MRDLELMLEMIIRPDGKHTLPNKIAAAVHYRHLLYDILDRLYDARQIIADKSCNDTEPYLGNVRNGIDNLVRKYLSLEK